MLESILQSLHDVDGVHGAMIVDHTAAVLAYRAHTIYDLPVLQQVARSVTNAAESVQLIQDDWDGLTAHYAEGKLVLRNLRTAGAKPRRYVLAVIADGTLNVAFLGVALRVAALKLGSVLEAVPAQVPATGPAPPVRGSAGTGRAVASELAKPELAKAGLSWSGANHSSVLATSGVATSGVATSDVSVSDAASSVFLSGCTRALAANIGPVAKMLVKEAVHKVCGARPFCRVDGPALIAHLTATIDNPDHQAMFQRTTRAL
jgi:predicted regulator of Ras-like GTPase activity (Roadblock/LC7/MglB family)